MVALPVSLVLSTHIVLFMAVERTRVFLVRSITLRLPDPVNVTTGHRRPLVSLRVILHRNPPVSLVLNRVDNPGPVPRHYLPGRLPNVPANAPPFHRPVSRLDNRIHILLVNLLGFHRVYLPSNRPVVHRHNHLDCHQVHLLSILHHSRLVDQHTCPLRYRHHNHHQIPQQNLVCSHSRSLHRSLLPNPRLVPV